MHLTSAHGNASLSFQAHDPDYFVVTYRANGLDASVRVGSYMSWGFAEFFSELATEWRGWEGTKGWSAFELECELRATADRRGHVTLSVALACPVSPTWSVKGELILEAGQLAGIAKAAQEFAQIGIRTT